MSASQRTTERARGATDRGSYEGGTSRNRCDCSPAAGTYQTP
jgi:hypothetical protein